MNARVGLFGAWFRRRWLWLAVGALLGVVSAAWWGGAAESEVTARATIDVLVGGGRVARGDIEPRVTLSAEAAGDTADVAENAARAALRRALAQIDGPVSPAASVQVEMVDAGPGFPLALLVGGGLPLGAVIGAVIAAAASLAMERTATTVFSARSLSSALGGAPVLSRLPERSLRPDRLSVRDEPGSSAAVAHRNVAAAVLGRLHRGDGRTVVVVAVDRTAARALLSANLAAALEESGRRVVVVAADRRRNDLDRALGVAGMPGLHEVLLAQEEVPFVPNGTGMRVMPSGRRGDREGRHTVPDPSRIAAVIDAGTRWADVVVLDSPPSPSFPDAQVLATVSDVAVVVATAGLTGRRELSDLQGCLVGAGVDIVGGVLVHSPAVRRGAVADGPADPAVVSTVVVS